MKSRLNKEYKQRFNELRVLVNSWNLIPDSPLDEFDSLNHLFLSQLYKGTDEFKIRQMIHFELINNYGVSSDQIDAQEMTAEVVNWWNNLKN